MAVELARGLEALGHDNEVLALGLGFDGGEDVDLPPLTRRSDAGLRALWLGAVALRAKLAANWSTSSSHTVAAAVEAAVLARRRGRPLIVWQRILGFPAHMWRPVRRLRWRGGRAPHRRRGRAHAGLGEELRKLGFDGPVWAIPNFRDPEPFVAIDRVAAAASLRSELDVPPGVGLVGFVGHLIAEKRPDRGSMRSRPSARSARTCTWWLPVTDRCGPSSRATSRRVSTDRVHVLGDRNDIPRILAAIDVFILTSDSEGLPGVLIEAQMAGCPVVTVPVGGVRDLVDDGETGIVTDDLDPGELAAASRGAHARSATPRRGWASAGGGGRCGSRRRGRPAR